MSAPPHLLCPTALRRAVQWAAVLTLGVGAAGCGGGSALTNADTIDNAPGTTGGQILSLVYFQRCVAPVLTTPITITINGTTTSNTCAAGGCHDTGTGTGGALRLIGSAAPAPFSYDPATQSIRFDQTPEVVRTSDMYKNFYSSFGETVAGQPDQSRLLNKPLVRGVLHGGGQIFVGPDDAAAKVIRYWISRPMPQGQDEFSSAANTMFTNADPVAGNCLTD